MKFKIGDRVRLKYSFDLRYDELEDEIFIVQGISNYNNDDILLKTGLDGSLESFESYRLKLVENENSVKDKTYYDNLNKIHNGQQPLRPEDLKVGMVFEITCNDKTIQYAKLIHIFKNTYFSFLRTNLKDWLGAESIHYNQMSGNTQYKLIDKVPPKEIEVEEEATVKLYKELYDKLMYTNYLLSSDLVGHGDGVFLNVGHQYDNVDNYAELCKIKRTVKKLVEFNWGKGIYE